MVKDDNLLRYCNDIWNKVSNRVNKELYCQPTLNENILKIKIKSYGDEASAFHAKKKPEAGSISIC